jgi:hypothetical protein
MEIRTKEYKVYNFEELSEEAKEKVQDNFYDYHNRDSYFLEEELTDLIRYDYPYFENPEFRWSLSYSQGDGLSFNSDIELTKFLDVEFPGMKKSVYAAICNILYRVYTDSTGRYCYASKEHVKYDYDYKQINNRPHLNSVIYALLLLLRDRYIEACKKYERIAEDDIAYKGTEEYAIDCCEANEYVFLEDGTQFIN